MQIVITTCVTKGVAVVKATRANLMEIQTATAIQAMEEQEQAGENNQWPFGKKAGWQH